MIKAALSLFLFLFLFLLLLLSAPVKVMAEEILSWENCAAEAKASHPDLISAEEKLRQAKAGQRIVASRLLPQIGSSLSLGMSRTEDQDKSDSYSYGVSGKQLIFDGFKTFYNRASAVENVKSAEYNYKLVSSNLRLRLKTAFADLLKAQELLKLTEQILVRRKQNLELVTLRYQAGREHRGSLLNAQANMAQAEAEVSQAKRNLELAQRRMVKELGRREFSPLLVKGELAIKNSGQKPDFENLAKTTPLLLDFTTRRESARLGVKAAEADFYPQISASASANRSSSEWPPDREGWSAGASLSFPLFTGGSRLFEVSRGKSVLNQVEADERSKRDSVILDLQQTWIDLQDAVENIEVQKKFLSAAEERAKITNAQYSIGLVTFDSWIIIEDDLVRTKKSFLNSQVNALAAESNWAQAKGETLDEK
ncbi:MAG: TolC family protein [Elusimicrobiota bacterium]